MSELRRFGFNGMNGMAFEECPDGNYVRFTDATARIAELEAKNKQLTVAANHLLEALDRYSVSGAYAEENLRELLETDNGRG